MSGGKKQALLHKEGEIKVLIQRVILFTVELLLYKEASQQALWGFMEMFGTYFEVLYRPTLTYNPMWFDWKRCRKVGRMLVLSIQWKWKKHDNLRKQRVKKIKFTLAFMFMLFLSWFWLIKRSYFVNGKNQRLATFHFLKKKGVTLCEILSHYLPCSYRVLVVSL